jgi:hypothetical protein
MALQLKPLRQSIKNLFSVDRHPVLVEQAAIYGAVFFPQPPSIAMGRIEGRLDLQSISISLAPPQIPFAG